jgi:Holliday junction resolvasome RuvABC ATP-dependent DNA helicase subunit
MPLVVNERMAQANSRLSAIRLAMFTLRNMERWRVLADDCQEALILVAVGAINGERLVREEGLEEELRDLRTILPQEHFRQCSISSVAAATGLNRETTRRKVNELIAEGQLIRTGRGRLQYAPGLAQSRKVSELVRSQLDALVRVTNELCRDGSLSFE